MSLSIEQRIEAESEWMPEKLGWENDGTAESNDIKRSFKLGANFVLNIILPEEIEKAIHWIIDSKYQYEAAHRWIDGSLEGSSPLYTTKELIELFKNRDNG